MLQHPAAWPENLDGSLTHCPHVEETYLVMLTSCFGSGLCPQLQWFPTSSLWPFSLACCAEVVQLTHSCLSGGIAAQNIGVHSVYWEGFSSAANLNVILNLPLNITVLIITRVKLSPELSVY